MLTLNKMIRKLSVKYSYINLTKGVKDYHTENHVTFLKEFKEDSGNGNTSHVHGWEDNTVTMSVLPRVVHRFSEFPIKIPTFLPSEKEKKSILKLFSQAKIILKKSFSVGNFTFLDFDTCFIAKLWC